MSAEYRFKWAGASGDLIPHVQGLMRLGLPPSWRVRHMRVKAAASLFLRAAKPQESMPKPLFSLVVPTRERHRTLAYAMQTVLFQTFPDFELIVQDNFSSDETWKTVRGFNTPRVKYNRTFYLMPINENWEEALAVCEGSVIRAYAR